MDDRLMIAAMAMQGMLAGGVNIHSESALAANRSLQFADALLAAAGEKDDPATHEDCVSLAVHNAVMDRLQVDFDALKAEIAALKRRPEPLTEIETYDLAKAWKLSSATVGAIVRQADRIRARRQP